MRLQAEPERRRKRYSFGIEGERGDTPRDLPLLPPLQTEGSLRPLAPLGARCGATCGTAGAARSLQRWRPGQTSACLSLLSATRKTVLPPACAGCEDSVRENHITAPAGHQLTHGDRDPHRELVLLKHVLKDDLTAQATITKSHSLGDSNN